MAFRFSTGTGSDGHVIECSASESAGLRVDPPFSISFWVYVHSADAQYRGLISWRENNSGYNIYCRESGGTREFSFYCRDESPAGWSTVIWAPGSDPQPTWGVWTHIYCEATSGGVISMFINGTARGGTDTIPSADMRYNSSPKFLMGRYGVFAYESIAHATMADVAIWDDVLTSDQIVALQEPRMGLPLQIKTGNLLAYWPLTRFGAGVSADATKRMVDWSKNQRVTEILEEQDNAGASSSGTGEGGVGMLLRPGSPIYVPAAPAAAPTTLRALALMQVGS